MTLLRLGSLRTNVTVIVALLVGGFSWLFRFNDPGGSFAGLTDDHFFYLVRGWQILFGDLPVRDFVDHGAPLYYYVGAAVQLVFGRGTLSEIAFSATALAVCAGLTFWVASLASGSIWAGLVGTAFSVLLEPRFYNYPKLLVYAVAIPLLWRFADRPSASLRAWLAVVTVVGFLFRHDHGAFVALAVGTLLLLVKMPWASKAKHAALYAVTVAVLVAPYLAFIQLNGGVGSYFRQAAAWAERDRDRAPVVWPGLFDNPDGVSDLAREGNALERVGAVVYDNRVAWLYYTEIALPVVALLLVAASRDGCRKGRWPHAKAKLATVAVLALALDAGFLRSPLDARLADPSVPLSVLIAWLVVAVPRALGSTSSLLPGVGRHGWATRTALLLVALPLAFVLTASLVPDVYEQLDRAGLTDRFGKGFDRMGSVTAQVRLDWQLESWPGRADHSELIDLAIYLNACTSPSDRILIQGYIPQVLALARRGFAGGHADLRPGFFGTDEAQRLTVERLRAQSVPLVLLDTGESYQNFRRWFSIVTPHIDQQYRLVGTRTFDERFGVTLMADKNRTPTGTYEPFGWPCFGTGRVSS